MPFDHTGFVDTNTQIKQILISAKARISRPELWSKGRTVDKEKVCAMGAILTALFIPIQPFTAINTQESGVCTVLDKMLEALPLRFAHMSVVGYNDADGITHDDVMAWFDRAIEATN